MTRIRHHLRLLLAVTALASASASVAALEASDVSPSDPEAEILEFNWRLGGFLGTIARAFLPGDGKGRLTTRSTSEGTIRTQLYITSPKSGKGDYYRYAAEIDPEEARTLRAESAYRFRGEEKEKQSDLEEGGVVDVASGIRLIRARLPLEPLELRIWSDGKVYPIVVKPMGERLRSVGGEKRSLQFFAIRPRLVPGERRWKGKMDLYLDHDEAATPVEISVDRSLAKVRLVLVDAG